MTMGMNVSVTPHIRYISIAEDLYFNIFSVSIRAVFLFDLHVLHYTRDPFIYLDPFY